MSLKHFLSGILSLYPALFKKLSTTEIGPRDADYYYSVWMRHLVRSTEVNNGRIPKSALEMGSGASLGSCYSALLSGVETVYAYDVVPFIQIDREIKIFRELVELFRNRSTIPGSKTYTKLKPTLDNYNFPELLTNDAMANNLEVARIEAIEEEIRNIYNESYQKKYINYTAPFDLTVIRLKDEIDFVFSQAVLEYPENIDDYYNLFYTALKKSGLLSAQIDYKSHANADVWYGDLCYSDMEWKIIKGKKKQITNRKTHSMQLEALTKAKFKLISEQLFHDGVKAPREKLHSRFKNIPEQDLSTTGAFIIGKK